MAPESAAHRGLGWRIGTKIGSFVRDRNVNKELDEILVESTQQLLEEAYLELGGETGEDVSTIQVENVLRTERTLIDLKASGLIRPWRRLVNKANLNTSKGLSYAQRFFSVRASDFTELVGIEQDRPEPEENAIERARHNERACVHASELLFTMKEDFDH